MQVVPSSALSPLTAAQLMSIWGSGEIPDEQLKPWFDCWQVSNEAEPQAELLQLWLRDQTPKRRADVLQFYTGSSHFTPPPQPHKISRQDNDTGVIISPTVDNELKGPVVLAKAGTCFGQLFLPAWRDAEEPKVSMETTLKYGSGFGLA